MSRGAWCSLPGLILLSWTYRARAEGPKSALEADLYLGWNRQIAPSVDHSYETWSRNGGLAVHGSMLLHTRYFLAAFVDVGYLHLYSRDEARDIGAPFGTVTSKNSLSAWSFMCGPAIDAGRVRIRAGIGMYNLRVHSTVLSTTIHPSEFDLGYLVTLGASLWRTDRWKIGVESRLFLISEAETAGLSAGLFGAWDTVKW